MLRRLLDTAFWPAALVGALVFPFIYTSDYFTSMAIIFGIYAATNLMWTLVIGTAGIYSFATLAIVGTAAYIAAYVGGGSRNFTVEQRGAPVWLMLLTAAAVGAVVGMIVAAPTIRLRGVYFALFTLGLVEFARTFFIGSETFGAAEGLQFVNRFVSTSDLGTDKARLIHYFSAIGLVAFALAVYWLVDRSRLGLLLRLSRESVQVADVFGVAVIRARFSVFLISSTVLGLIGGVYVAIFGSVSPTIFSFDTLLLLFAMMVVGGLGSPRGAVLGVLVVLFIDERLNYLGPMRFVIVGVIMLAVTLLGGLAGVRGTVAGWIAARAARRWPGQTLAPVASEVAAEPGRWPAGKELRMGTSGKEGAA